MQKESADVIGSGVQVAMFSQKLTDGQLSLPHDIETKISE